MFCLPRSTFRPALALLALATVALALVTSPAGAAPAAKHRAIVLDTGTPDRLALAVSGDSRQDGAGSLTGASFTGLAQFTVRYATGSYAGTTGTGLASFSEDAAHHHRMTLVGRPGGTS
jgi:hypothetical protein